jgi:hypothetical protein
MSKENIKIAEKTVIEEGHDAIKETVAELSIIRDTLKNHPELANQIWDQFFNNLQDIIDTVDANQKALENLVTKKKVAYLHDCFSDEDSGTFFVEYGNNSNVRVVTRRLEDGSFRATLNYRFPNEVSVTAHT